MSFGNTFSREKGSPDVMVGALTSFAGMIGFDGEFFSRKAGRARDRSLISLKKIIANTLASKIRNAFASLTLVPVLA